jgi:hypothetical protein
MSRYLELRQSEIVCSQTIQLVRGLQYTHISSVVSFGCIRREVFTSEMFCIQVSPEMLTFLSKCFSSILNIC